MKNIIQEIDQYLKGKMTEAEELDFWNYIIRFPEYLELLETEYYLRLLYKRKNLK